MRRDLVRASDAQLFADFPHHCVEPIRWTAAGTGEHKPVAVRVEGIAIDQHGTRCIKAVLTVRRQGCAMVTRKRFRTVLNALALYTIAALVIGYFGVNAYSGNRGLRAKQDLDQQIAELSAELDALKAERANWERRVSLLKSESIDPDMLDERARVLLNYADPRELTLRLKKQP